jgi:hypothetical protein
MAQALRKLPDVVVVERRQNVRVIVSIPGKYSLTSRRDAQGNRRQFACRAVTISAAAVVVSAPVIGEVGERVIAHIGEFGRLEGKICRLLDRGFVMTIMATEEERARLAKKVLWLERHKNFEAPECREHGRIVPEDPHSTLILADGRRLTCLVIDMSVSGAAVSADLAPEIGMPLALGRVIGRVVRRFDEGFALQFLTPQEPQLLAHMLIQR